MVLPDTKKIFAKLVEKWPAKVFSIVIAILLFVFHRMSDIQERFFSLPLNLEISNSLIPGDTYPQNIRVTLRGDANSIYPIAESDIEVFVDLREYSEPGNYKVPVQIRKQGSALDTDTLVISVDPQEISIFLDLKMSKSVPLSPVFQGYLESGYEMVFYSLEPDKLVIDGPVSIVSEIKELATGNIDLRNRNADFSERVAVINPNPLLAIRGGGYADFFAHVGELIMMRSFDDLPVVISGLGEGFEAELEIDRGSVRFEGNQTLLENFEPAINMLSVDCSEISDSGTYTLPLKVEIPPELTLSRQEPEEIRVRISRTGDE